MIYVIIFVKFRSKVNFFIPINFTEMSKILLTQSKTLQGVAVVKKNMASCLPKLADTIWLFLANLWLCQHQKIFQLYSSLLWHTICTVPFWEKFPKISGKRQILRSLESFLLLDHPETRPFYATLGMTKMLWYFKD